MKKLWQRLPKLSRKWKTVRNIAFVLLTALLLPAALRWPALTQDGALAKMQGKYLLSPSEILYRTRQGDTRGYLLQGEGWVAAGQVQKYDSTSRPLERDVPLITQVLSREEPGVLMIPARDRDSATVLAAFGGPEEAAQAELTLEVAAVEPDWGPSKTVEDETFIVRCQREENGYYFFRLLPHDHGEAQYCVLDAVWMRLLGAGDDFAGDRYTLIWEDAQGQELSRLTGEIPEYLNLRDFW